MPDYDLGRAHGRVVIDSDTDGVQKGVRDTDREFKKLEQIAARLDKAMSGARRAAVNITRSFIDMNGGVKGTYDNFQKARNIITSFSLAATVAQRDTVRLLQSFNRLKNSINVIKGIGNAFGMWLTKMDNISPFTKVMMNIYGGIQLFRTGQTIVAGLASRFNFLAVAMAGLGRGFVYLGRITGITKLLGLATGGVRALGAATGITRTKFAQMTRFLLGTGAAFLGVSGGFQRVSQGLTKLGVNMNHFNGTLATVRKAFSQTLGVTERITRAFTRTAFFVAYAKVAYKGFQAMMRLVAKSVAVLAFAATGLTVAMQFLGSAVMGTWDALKQLSGITAALPGAIAIAGAAMLTLKIATNGVGDAMKALGGDAGAFEEAIAKLSPAAQDSLRALREFVPRFKEIQTAAQDALFSGLADQIREVGGPVMDLLSRGTLAVSKSFNSAGQQIIDFTGKGQTISDLDSIFRSTDTVVRNFAKSIQPLGRIFMDFATVGAETLAGFSLNMSNATTRMAEFVREARNTGQIKAWILDAVQGFRDFRAAMGNIGQVLGEVFAQFGASGESGLARFRAMTETFAAWFDRVTQAGSAVGAFADRLQTISTRYITLIGDVFEALEPSIRKIIPWLEKVALQIDDGIRTAVAILNPFIKTLAALLNGPLADGLAGVAAKAITMVILLKTFKLLAGAVTPIIAGLAALRIAAVGTFGAISTAVTAAKNSFRNLTPSVVVAGQAMGRFGTYVFTIGGYIPVLRKMQISFIQVQASVNRLAVSLGVASVATRTLATGFGLAAAAARGLATAASTAMAFLGGPVGVAILAISGLAYAFFDANKTAREFGQSTADQINNVADRAVNLVTAFEEAKGALSEGVFNAIDENTKQYMATLENMESRAPGIFAKIGASFSNLYGGELSKTVRASYQLGEQSKRTQAAIGNLEGGVDSFNEALSNDEVYDSVVAQLKAMGSEGTSALSDLVNMKTEYQVIQQSMERIGPASLALGEAIKVIADESASASDKLAAMRIALQSLGILESNAQAAAFDMAAAITEVAEAAMTAADGTKPLGQALMNMDGTLKSNEPNAAKLREELMTLGNAMLNTASQGGDVDAAWGDMQGSLQMLADAFKLPIDKVQMLARQFGVVPDQLRVFVALNGADEAQQELAKFAEQALQTTSMGPMDIPVVLKTQGAKDALTALGIEFQVFNENTGEAKVINVSTEEAQAAIQTLKLSGIDLAQINPRILVGVDGEPLGQLNAIEGAANSVDGADPTVNATVEGAALAEDAIKKLGETAREEIPPVGVDVKVQGAVEGRTQLDELGGAVNGALGTFENFATGVQSTMGTAVGEVQTQSQTATTELQNAANAADASGRALGAGFAAGIASQIDAVQQAALDLAAAAAAPLPRSPAKIGPFSGRGWTPYRGMSLAAGFAEGIGAGSPLVEGRALAMAQAVEAAINSIRGQLGFTNPEPVALRDQIGDTKYIRNETSDAELRQKNEEKIAERIASDEKSKLKDEQKKAKDAAKEAALPPEEKKKEEPETSANKDPRRIAEKAQEEADKAAEERLKSALQVLKEGNSDAATTAGAVEELRQQGFPSDEATVKALNDLGGRDSTDADAVRALGVLDATIQNEGDIERKETLEALRDAGMDRRGIEEYDPFADASENILDDSVAIGNDLIGLFDTVKQGLGAAKDLGKLLIRGFSSTDDITTAIDGVQSIASAFGSIASTVGNVVSTVGSIAAALGSAIPGIGQVAAGIGMFTSALGSANGLIDLAQDIFKLGGQIVGGFLSKIAGGADGALMGDVKMLLDTNSGELKRWSADNPDDKRSTKVMQGTGKTTNTGVENLNIYQGPGQDPYRMVDSAMFAVKAASQGAYA